MLKEWAAFDPDILDATRVFEHGLNYVTRLTVPSASDGDRRGSHDAHLQYNDFKFRVKEKWDMGAIQSHEWHQDNIKEPT